MAWKAMAGGAGQGSAAGEARTVDEDDWFGVEAAERHGAPPVDNARSGADDGYWSCPGGVICRGGVMESDEEFEEEEVPADIDIIAIASHSRFGRSPFLLGVYHKKASPSVLRCFMKNVDKTDAVEGHRVWFRHGEPGLITLTCSDLRCAFSREGRLYGAVADGMARVFTAYDKLMYLINGITDNMWRHWVPSSFACAVRDGEDFMSPRFRDMFVGGHLGYSVQNCRMILMTVPRDALWATYVWDFLSKEITVLDPYLQGAEVGKLEWVHDEVMDCLHEALFDCIDAWFPGWEIDRSEWVYSHPNALGRRCRDYNSGVMALHYGLHFDGDRVNESSIENDNGLIRGDMLFKMLQMPGNSGDLPDFLPKEIQVFV